MSLNFSIRPIMLGMFALCLVGPAQIMAGTSVTREELDQHGAALAKKYATNGFTIVVQQPFVVLGDEAPGIVQARAQQTIQWAVDRLKQDYFARDPEEIIDIWLFKDKASYEKNALALFHDHPDTPFGYYSPQDHALVMNIATGGGTLIHEIVHPFMRANFAKCPAWFNEGLASLYEQAGDQQGHIKGFPNWRLAGLQKAIEGRTVPSFEKLTATDDNEFYEEDRGTNYGQARYLCYYLQENGLLQKFYREFVAHQKDDPTGFQTLKTILGESDMDAFKRKWEQFVMKLKFP